MNGHIWRLKLHWNAKTTKHEDKSYVHHAASGLDCATQRRGGLIVSEEGDLVKLLHVWVVRVCPICECVHVSSHCPRTQCWWCRRAVGSFVLWEPAGPTELLHSEALQLVDVEGEFEGGAKLQAHVLHHHVAAQQHEGLAVNLLERKEGRKE